MHTLEKQAIEALHGCTFQPGTFTKRFVRSLYAGREGEQELTVRQKLFLWSSAFRFRRQIYAPGRGKDTVWIASLITGRTDKKYPLPRNYPNEATGFAQTRYYGLIREYISELKILVSKAQSEIKQKANDAAPVVGIFTRRRCGCVYADGTINKACDRHYENWRHVLSAA